MTKPIAFRVTYASPDWELKQIELEKARLGFEELRAEIAKKPRRDRRNEGRYAEAIF